MTTISRRCFQSVNSLPWHGKTRPCTSVVRSCYYSSATSSVNFDAIRAEMLSRPAQHIWDVMSPTNSHLLNIALADFIPPSCQPAHFAKAGVVHPVGRSYDQASIRDARDEVDELNLPEGHQLVYFPPQIRSSGMLPDGTDPFQSPGAPFVRRMWAGGSFEFGSNLPLNSSPALCVESINEVSVKGPPGEEKIFVDVLRRYMDEIQFQQELQNPSGKEDFVPEYRKGPIERRTLVFMQRRGSEEIKPGALQVSPGKERIVKAPKTADFSITLTPTPMLLFDFSALTYNAHSIHLNPEYCRVVEGHRNLLVHGPLSLTLMLSTLRSQLGQDTQIRRIDYRNVAPLYVDEPMTVCVRRNDNNGTPPDSQKWDVWVENKDGGLSIKGTALIGPRKNIP